MISWHLFIRRCTIWSSISSICIWIWIRNCMHYVEMLPVNLNEYIRKSPIVRNLSCHWLSTNGQRGSLKSKTIKRRRSRGLATTAFTLDIKTPPKNASRGLATTAFTLGNDAEEKKYKEAQKQWRSTAQKQWRSTIKISIADLIADLLLLEPWRWDHHCFWVVLIAFCICASSMTAMGILR